MASLQREGHIPESVVSMKLGSNTMLVETSAREVEGAIGVNYCVTSRMARILFKEDVLYHA